jgi:hypothetical protein
VRGLPRSYTIGNRGLHVPGSAEGRRTADSHVHVFTSIKAASETVPLYPQTAVEAVDNPLKLSNSQ